MPRINGDREKTGGDGVVFSVPDDSADGTTWAAFQEKPLVDTVKSALSILQKKIAVMDGVNDFFVKLPNHRSFKDIVDDPRVWICHDPKGPASAETVGTYITLGREPLRWGVWAVAATLVHEMAHIGGATDEDGQAEKALLHAGLKEHYVKTNAVPKARR